MAWAPERPSWELVPPAYSYMPEWSSTAGPTVADFCAVMDFPPDPEQELILDATFGVASDGLPAAAEGAVVCSRQNIKSSGLEMVALGWLFVAKEPLILWSAHEFKTAKENYLHLRGVIESKPWLARQVAQFYGGADMAIVLRDKGPSGVNRRIDFVARTTSQGRGKSAPKQIWDEGLELQPEHVAASDAISSTYPWAQTLTGSSGGKAYSGILSRMVSRGRAGTPGRHFYLEWADDLPGDCEHGEECTHVYGSPGCRLDDRARIQRSNPTVGRIRPGGRGLTYEAIERERAKQSDPLKFARERLTWHEQIAVRDAAVFDEASWAALASVKSQIDDPVLALHVSPDRAWSAIVAGGWSDEGRIHLEVASRAGKDGARTYARRPSTAWVVPTLAKMVAKLGPTTLLILAGSAAASLIPALAKIHGLDIELVPDSSMPAACGFFLDAVGRQEIAHVGDPELQASILSVARKTVGDRAFVWSPASSSGDISAAMAATMLAWWLEASGGADYDPLDSVG